MNAPESPGSPAPRPPGWLNVDLYEMIGSGKTVIEERLPARLGPPFFDLHREVDRELGRSFHELGREEGWLAFRERAYAPCRCLADPQRAVIALGGGTLRYAWNSNVPGGTGVMILLDAELGVLAERVRRADRPPVNPGASLEEDLRRIWSAAGHLDRQAADLIYRTDPENEIEAEVSELPDLLAARGIT